MDTVTGYAGYFDWQALRDQILLPHARQGGATRPSFAGGAAEVVIVEGVLTARPQLACHYDLAVFVATPAELCLHRLYERGHTPGRHAWITRWRAVEEYHLAATQLHEGVHLAVHGA